MSSAPLSSPAHALSKGALIRRLFGLAGRYKLHCLQVLGIQLVLLTMGIVGLSFTGLGIDYIRHKVQGVPLAGSGAPPVNAAHDTTVPTVAVSKFHLALPDDWPPLQVLGMLAGLILSLALCRAVFNYVYA